jgi:TonB family protein
MPASTSQLPLARQDGVALFSCLVASRPRHDGEVSFRAVAAAAFLHAAVISGFTFSPQSEEPVPVDSQEVVTLVMPDLEKILARVKQLVQTPPGEVAPVEEGGATGGAEPTMEEIDMETLEAAMEARGIDNWSTLAVSPDFALLDELGREGRSQSELFDFELPPQLRMTLEQLASEPIFTPYTAGPVLKNRDKVKWWLDRSYPPLLLDSGVGGYVVLWFLIDDGGRIRRVLVKEKSTFKSFDDAALRIAKRMEFSPAVNNGLKVPVWVALPVEFRAGS